MEKVIFFRTKTQMKLLCVIVQQLERNKMRFKVEMFIDREEFDIPTNKSKSMINALQREQILETVEQALPGVWVTKVRKVHDERTCT
jgi:hypothetical protein